MTREENLHWLNKEIETWENECQSKHPIKEALYSARKALEQESTLEKDGTLIVTTEHYKNVGRVLVQCGTNGTLFYQDQEPFKPMVEIDLYSVINQKYIEREVLDKIRAEIAEYGSIMVAYAITKNTKTDKGIEKLVRDVLKQAKKQVLAMIDKYKAESEE